MKKMTLDSDDRRALATLGSYLLLLLCAVLVLGGATVALALCVRLFLLIMGAR